MQRNAHTLQTHAHAHIDSRIRRCVRVYLQEGGLDVFGKCLGKQSLACTQREWSKQTQNARDVSCMHVWVCVWRGMSLAIDWDKSKNPEGKTLSLALPCPALCVALWHGIARHALHGVAWRGMCGNGMHTYAMACMRMHGRTGAGGSVEEDALGGLDADAHKELRVGQGQLDHFAQLAVES